MPTREKQDNQDDDPNNQRQSRERYREHKEPAADRHWIQQATEVEAENHAWMDRAFVELAAEGRSEQHGRHQGQQRKGAEQQYQCQRPNHNPFWHSTPLVHCRGDQDHLDGAARCEAACWSRWIPQRSNAGHF